MPLLAIRCICCLLLLARWIRYQIRFATNQVGFATRYQIRSATKLDPLPATKLDPLPSWA